MTKTAKLVGFIETMDCLAVPKIPEGPEWTYEIKLDGFRVEAIKRRGKVTLYSLSGNILNTKFPHIAHALKGLPDGTILDGELVALDTKGRSVFNLLQNFRSAEAQIHYYAYDILVLKGKDLTQLTLTERRGILNRIAPENDHVSLSAVSPGPVADLLKFVKAHGLEGVVAKLADSVYQPRKRTGLWRKHRINLGQEFVIGGYTPGTHGIDALMLGFYQGNDLIYRSHFADIERRSPSSTSINSTLQDISGRS